MDFRKILRRDAFWDKNPCPFYMCEGNGVAEFGVPGREYERLCLCATPEAPKKLAVQWSTEETVFELQEA